jgi:signal transduction histidine kinase
MLRLKIYDGQEKLNEVELGKDVVTFGRDDVNTAVLPDVSVSRRHAQVEPSGNFYVIRDNGSTNGTFVNEMVVRLHVLNHGDTIRVGKYTLVVDSRSSPSGDTTRVRVEQLKLAGDVVSLAGEAFKKRADRGALDKSSRDELLRLFDVQRKIAHVDTTDVVLDRTLEIALEEVNANRGGFLISTSGPLKGGIDGDDDALAASFHPAALQDRNEKAAANEDLVIPQELVAKAVRESREFSGELPGPTGQEEMKRPFLVCPVEDRTGVHGVLFLERSPDQPPFAELDLRFLRAATTQVAASLANARLFAEISEQNAKVETIIANLTDGVLVTDDEFHVLEANTAATMLLGLSSTNPVGCHLFKLLGDFVVTPEPAILEGTAVAEGAIFHLHSAGKDSTEARLLAGRITPFPRETGNPHGLVVTLRDRSRAKQADELKTQFLENVAHKLRSPLTVVQGNLEVVRAEAAEGKPPPTDVLDDLERNASTLAHMVGDFVDFIELQTRTNRFVAPPQPTKVKKVLREAIRLLADEASRKEILMVERLSDELPPIVVQPDLLLRAFSEILGNAVKFSAARSRIVVEGQECEGYLHLKFVDNGPGIPDHEIESVFYVCHQVDRERTGQVPGAGLGLALARHIVQEHGGEIQIASPYGFADHGTCVSLFLPSDVTDQSRAVGANQELLLLPRTPEPSPDDGPEGSPAATAANREKEETV